MSHSRQGAWQHGGSAAGHVTALWEHFKFFCHTQIDAVVGLNALNHSAVGTPSLSVSLSLLSVRVCLTVNHKFIMSSKSISIFMRAKGAAGTSRVT